MQEAGAGEMVLARLRDDLIQLLSIPSESGKERELLLFLEQRLKGLGLPLGWQEVAPGHANLVLNPLQEPALLVVAHADTVPVVIEGRACLLRPAGEKIYGRGAADVKGGIAALISALEGARETAGSLQGLPVSVVFTVDEEKGGSGSAAAAASCRPREVLALEPTGLAVCPVEAGSLTMRIRTAGRPAHGSVPEAGENAVEQMLELIRELSSLPFLAAEHPLLGRSSFTIQKMAGGSDELAVPGCCELIADVRLLPGQDPKAVEEEIARLCAARAAVCETLDASAPFAFGQDLPLVTRLLRKGEEVLGRPLEVRGFLSWSDAENFAAAGVPAVVFGPGRLEVAHTPEEHITLGEVEQAARVLRALFLDYF